MMALVLALVLFVLSMAGDDPGSNTPRDAAEVAVNIQKRLRILDGYIRKVETSDEEDIRILKELPEDMVIYRYVNDSLRSWNNQFSTLNDDISSRLLFYRLTDRRASLISPLAEVTDEISYMNIGPKWYLIKLSANSENQKIIAGLEIKNTLIDDARRNENGVNPKLKLSRRYAIIPLTHSGGSSVIIEGKPLFKIIYEGSRYTHFFDNSMLRWLSVFFFVFAIIMFSAGHRTLKVYTVAVSTLTMLLFMSYLWAIQMNGSSEIFSPTIYADGPLFFSLGALILINTYITLLSTCSFFIRNRLAAMARKDRLHRKRNMAIYGAVIIFMVIGIALYTNHTLQSLLLNSNISMELYRWNMNIPYTLLVYFSYTGLLFSILLQLHALRPVVKEFTGLKYDMLAPKTLILFAIVCSAYFTVTSSYLGFKKEEDRISVWANRLSVDRELSLEIQLRSIEESIAYDALISAMSFLDNSENMVEKRISDFYLTRMRQPYNIDVNIFNENDIEGQLLFNTITRNGIPIAQGSRFLFLADANGMGRYAGIFIFYHPQEGTRRMILTIVPQADQED